MTPADIVQNGPARIVSFSRDSLARNFTLGQDGADIDFRLRTPISGPNGTAVNLRTRTSSLAPRKTHVVVTYEQGVESLYIDRHRYPANVDLRKADILISFGTPKHTLSKFAYAFCYFFPVSFFLSLFLSQRLKNSMAALLIPGAVAIGLLTFAELHQAYSFGRSLDWALLTYGSVVAVIGVLSGARVAVVNPRVSPSSGGAERPILNSR